MGSKYTLFCLESKIYIYEKSGTELFDCVECKSPEIFAAICFEQSDLTSTLMIASLAKDEKEVVEVRDYNHSCHELSHRIKKPFGKGYPVGGMSFGPGGKQFIVVSQDGCYVNFYQVSNSFCPSDHTVKELVPI